MTKLIGSQFQESAPSSTYSEVENEGKSFENYSNRCGLVFFRDQRVRAQDLSNSGERCYPHFDRSRDV